MTKIKKKKAAVSKTKRRASKRQTKAKVATVLVKYSSNNSGGSWWLKDADWLALERAGWHVEWGGNYFCKSKYKLSNQEIPPGKPEPCENPDDCHGHRRFDTAVEADTGKNGRWLGALAKYASKAFETPGDAMREFEQITRQSVSDEGCNCCGAPHTFEWNNGYASGESCLTYLFPDKKIPWNLREFLETGEIK
jgi:hypothetical protein